MKRVISNRENKDILSIMEEEKERLSHSASVLEKELGGYVSYVLSSPIFMTYMIINRKKSIPSKTTNAPSAPQSLLPHLLYEYLLPFLLAFLWRKLKYKIKKSLYK